MNTTIRRINNAEEKQVGWIVTETFRDKNNKEWTREYYAPIDKLEETIKLNRDFQGEKVKKMKEEEPKG